MSQPATPTAFAADSARTAPYDVVVIGAGPAGVCAAVQAARAGARTLLVEKSGMLGGTTTVAGVNLPGLFHAWGRQVIAGVGWDIVTEAVRLAGDELPDFRDYRRPHYQLQIRVSSILYAAALDRAVVAAGADLLLHTMLAGLHRSGDSWTVSVCTKEGLRQVTAAVVVDCTGDANAVAQAGFPLQRSAALQPGTIIARFGGYDLAALDVPAIESAWQVAVARGELRREDMQPPGNPVGGFLAARGDNSIHVVGVDGSTSHGRTQAELAARQTLVRILGFLRRQPGLERVVVNTFANECGIRETDRIVGQATVTLDDYVSGRLWPDAVCHSFYPIDVHRANGAGIDIRPLPEGVVPSIPRGALIPAGSTGLLAAGRCISGDQEASSAYRVQATCMATGQAAGALAALAADLGCTPADVPLPAAYGVLRAAGAIVPGDPLRTPAVAGSGSRP